MDELASQGGISKSCLSLAFPSQILYQSGPVCAFRKSLILAAISRVLRPGIMLERNAFLNSAKYWLPYYRATVYWFAIFRGISSIGGCGKT
jgi:hypothetical protein